MEDNLRDFLDHLSQIVPHSFQIMDSERCLYSSQPNGLKPAQIKPIFKFSEQVIEGNGLQNTYIEDQPPVFGYPLQIGPDKNLALITFDSNRTVQDQRSTQFCSFQEQDQEMEVFLTSLARVIEDKWKLYNESEEMAEDLLNQYEEFNLFSQIGTQTKTFDFSRDHLQELMDEIQFLVESDLMFADLPEHPEYSFMTLKSDYTGDFAQLKSMAFRIIEMITRGSQAQDEDYFILNDSREHPEFKDLHPEPYRCLAVKIKNAQAVFGWLGMISFDLDVFFQNHTLKLLSALAEQSAVAITNASLYHDLEEFNVNLVKTLVHVIEAKDEYTRGHSVRVNELCMLMADHLCLDDKARNELYWASLLHDIGKIGTPESVLNKPNGLTYEEFKIIKEHPTRGYRIIEPLGQLSGSLPGILNHHERIDGQGYPEGLAGESIPYQARIIAVADTYDAITSDRAYRPGKSHSQALQIIKEVAGTQLDRDLVSVFIEIMDKQ